jgi:hypothetical protein
VSEGLNVFISACWQVTPHDHAAQRSNYARGNPFNGLSFFESNGTETADQVLSGHRLGDGLSGAGTITGDFSNGFQDSWKPSLHGRRLTISS